MAIGARVGAVIATVLDGTLGAITKMPHSKFLSMTYVAALCATLAPMEARGQEMIRIDGVTLIDSFLGFTAGDLTEYPEQRLGVSLPYYRDDTILTAYIYHNDLEPFPTFVTDEAAIAHFQQITVDVFDVQQQGVYLDVELRSQFSLDDNMGRVDWFCSMFRLRLPTWDTTGNSISCLAVSGWNFLKIRMSSNVLSDEQFVDLALRVASTFALSAGL